MSLDRRVVRNIQSVIALRNYLCEIAQHPAKMGADDGLLAALKSQGCIAKFRSDERGIRPSSLNTVKRIADICLDGGFEALDRLRLDALESISSEVAKSNRSNKIDKIGLRKRVQELETENLQLREDLLRLTRVFGKSLVQGRNYASKADRPAVLALCIREQCELRTELSLMTNDTQSNVVSINHG